LNHEVEHKEACEQFEKEVHLLSKLDHPGVVKMFDAFVEDHRAYLVLEMINGRTLKQEVQDSGAIPYERVLALCSQMISILEYLHTGLA
ncbi:protein kinase domain-containing protein, partial [Klebsiella pneumoniae]|uniref:protein kinase domain-containing protein n=1 Tax=Klebsiella pneumoniae TaxID=573 RepID=UPI003D031371